MSTSQCPKCAKQLDTHAPTEAGAKPVAGDISVCLYCKTILVFDENIKLRRATKSELQEFEQNKDLWKLLQGALGLAIMITDYPD